MQQLIIIRHAQAVHDLVGGQDRDRPLTEQGEREAQALAEKLIDTGMDLSGAHLWHSTARRAAQTARAIAAKLPASSTCLGVDALYDLDMYGILELVCETPRSVRSLIIVGHNPAVAETCRHLTNNTVDDRVHQELAAGFPPGTTAIFSVASDWAGLSPNTATLTDVLHP